jgi:Cys-tRNA(Pro)/Cys-tRNA(Cys) deacylase
LKTNAARLLDQLGLAYELGEYDVDPQDLSAETVGPISRDKRVTR